MTFATRKLFAVFFSVALCAQARLADVRLRGNRSPRPSVPRVPIPEDAVLVMDPSGNALPPLNTTYYFDQLIDHNNPSLGTFKQRYYHTWQFYEQGAEISSLFLL